MKARLPLGVILVAVLQFIPPLIVPPAMLKGMSMVIWGFVAVVFGALGLNLLRGRAWSRVATIFVQGFNIIVRLLVLVGHVLVGGEAGAPFDWPMVTALIISMLLSAVVLYYVDTPDVQVMMQ